MYFVGNEYLVSVDDFHLFQNLVKFLNDMYKASANTKERLEVHWFLYTIEEIQ